MDSSSPFGNEVGYLFINGGGRRSSRSLALKPLCFSMVK